MSKQPKKKRHKPYQGNESTPAPIVRRYIAEPRGPIKEWWRDHQPIIKLLIIIGGGAVVVWLLLKAIQLILN